MPRTLVAALLLALAATLLAVGGCGKKGRLYLPPEATAPPPAAPSAVA